jgi:hypothetical protein
MTSNKDCNKGNRSSDYVKKHGCSRKHNKYNNKHKMIEIGFYKRNFIFDFKV